jgi:hypothetical protein
MPLPEGYLPREGDVLVLHGTVKFDYDPGEEKVWIRLMDHWEDDRIPISSVVGVHCRKWEQGEQVRHRNVEHCFGEIVATCDDMVWVKLAADSKRGKKFSAGQLATFHCNELEPDEQAEILADARREKREMELGGLLAEPPTQTESVAELREEAARAMGDDE